MPHGVRRYRSGSLSRGVGWDLDLERLVNDLLDRGPACHQPRTKDEAARDFRVGSRWNLNLAGKAATSEMPAVDEDMNVERLVPRPDDFKVAEIPELTQSIVEDIESASLIRTGYRPSDLLLEKFALIAVRVILECEYDVPAIDDPFRRRRSDVLAATLVAKAQRVREICK